MLMDVDSEISVGDVVSLKSGGVRMTVNYVDEEMGYFSCKWFDGAICRDEVFSPGTLILEKGD